MSATAVIKSIGVCGQPQGCAQAGVALATSDSVFVYNWKLYLNAEPPCYTLYYTEQELPLCLLQHSI
ncbi:hypothetical protein CBL_08067 [Carabus blaptoides fortunei]